MNDIENESVLTLRQVGLVLLATLSVFLIFIFWIEIIGETVALFIGEIILVAPALVYVIYRKWPVFKTFRLLRVNVKQTAATVFLFAPVFILIDELDRVIQLIFPMPEAWLESLVELVQFDSFADAVLITLAVVVVAAVSEEMLFRGILQHSLEIFREPAIAIVLTSVLFALIHFSPWTSIQITLLGWVLGYTAWKSGSILPSIIVHGLNNLLSLLMMNASEGALNWYAKGDHVNTIWLVLAVVFVIPAFRFFKSTFD